MGARERLEALGRFIRELEDDHRLVDLVRRCIGVRQVLVRDDRGVDVIVRRRAVGRGAARDVLWATEGRPHDAASREKQALWVDDLQETGLLKEPDGLS